MKNSSKQDKINLLRRIEAGQVEIIDGHFVDKESIILFEKNGLKYFDNQCTKQIVNFEKLAGKHLIILPFNGRD